MQFIWEEYEDSHCHGYNGKYALKNDVHQQAILIPKQPT